ncbi:unnamed protein product [Rhizophagus irregularis]|nr:unnamed protein product [Rhizophagus irregularis]
MFPQKNPLESSNILNYLKRNLICWTSRNEKIDNFIQEMQLKFNNKNNVVFEWIPYNQFNEIKESDKNGLITLYSAIWKDGPILFGNNWYNGYTRESNKKVALKCLHNSQDSIDFLINETKKYSTDYKAFLVLYGISQNPDTNNYILVQNNSINLANWINKNSLRTVYSAIWKDGPLFYEDCYDEYTRNSNKKVTLICLHNSQDSIDFLINEAKMYSTNYNAFITLYGISQNPDTNNYILVHNNSINLANWISGNEKINDFIQEQLKIRNHYDNVFEWIPYNQLDKIKETGKNDSTTVYSVIWKDGPLFYNDWCNEYIRNPNKKVTLKYFHNSQNSIDFLINKVKKYSTKRFNRVICNVYEVSQNPNTNNYILVLEWASGNEKLMTSFRKCN